MINDLSDTLAAIREYEKVKKSKEDRTALANLFKEEEKKRLKQAQEEDELKARFARAAPKSSFEDSIKTLKTFGRIAGGLDIDKIWLDDLIDSQIVEKAIEEAEANPGVTDYETWGGF